MEDDYQPIQQTVQSPNLNPEEGVLEERDELNLEIDDAVFIQTSTRLIENSRDFFNQKKNLKQRREDNEKYLFGRQTQDLKLKNYNTKFNDNIMYEAMAYLKPIALSRMPDILVKPGNESPQAQQTADDLTKIVDSDIKSDKLRKVLGLAFNHRPVYFIACIKPFWNPEIGKDGDYDFRVVHPKNLVVDNLASSLDPQDHRFIAELVEYSVEELVMRFPEKEQDLYKELRRTKVFNNQKNEKTKEGMSTKVAIWEIWFTWYEKSGKEYQRLEGVGWFYEKLLFKKMKNPYWDWTGEDRLFSYDKPVDENTLKESITTQKPVLGEQTQKVFHNHFDNPQKPYILIGYDQWGVTPMDETSVLEQVRLLQDNLDKRGRQISDMLDRRGKHIFSTDSGLKKEDIEEMDLNNPDEDLLLDGNVQEVHNFIQGEQPSAQMIQDKTDTRERIFQKMGVNAPLRGQSAPGDQTATETQINREGDFTRADDLVEETINIPSRKIANWILQFIKLFYTEDHFVRLIGEDGKPVFLSINRDAIQDGMEVTISASGVDKLKAEQRAFDMAKIKMIDPYNFYKDIGASDPKGRTAALMEFLVSPNSYAAKYTMGLNNPQQMGQALNGQSNQPQTGQPQGQSPQALQDIMQLQQGQIPPVPNVIDPAYLQTLNQWLDSPDFQQLIQQRPDLKDKIVEFLKQVQQVAQRQGGQPNQEQTPEGPVANQNPSPQNPNRVAINPPQRAGNPLMA